MPTGATTGHTVIDSPIGPLTLGAADGALVALYLNPPSPTEALRLGPPVSSGFEDVVEQLAEYFAGRLTHFDLRIELRGTPFQREVWQALQEIPFGETWSYGRLAGRVGRPGAARAVGLANGRNPVSIVVPCHRVIGSSGALTGYGGGLPRKAFLLDLERRHRAVQPDPAALF